MLGKKSQKGVLFIFHLLREDGVEEGAEGIADGAALVAESH